jgi:hypothetical protein
VTPAIDILMLPPQVRVEPADQNMTFPLVFCNPAPVLQNTFALFPTQASKFEFRGGIPQLKKDDIEHIRAGTKKITFWGVIFFKDIFGTQHCTRYCWIFKGQSMGGKDADLCLQHNDTH